ncbi:DUF389 domain-containing protein [Amycolatopsis sp. NPDC023774]|uniref:DUF389 domain-containing protein n=1 Tax=Amycolatopsis sp. NPDC023774 TaxID=3155015 RepID=UPI003401D8ED
MRPGLARAAAALLLLLAWVVFPGERSTALTVFGGLLLAVTLVEAISAARLAPAARPAGLLRSVGPAVAGLILLFGGHDATRMSLAVGALIAVRGLADLGTAATVGRALLLRPWLVFLGTAELALAVATLAAPDLFGQATLVAVGFVWLGGGLATVLVPTRADIAALTIAPVPPRGPMDDTERARIADEVYFDGPGTRTRLVRFVVLLTLAAVIATYGVLSDSDPTVIGAMIVAPLMVPIQALAAGVVSGVARRALVAAAVVIGGIALVLTVAMLIAATFPDLASSLQDAQVTSRTSPTLTDLAIALAAGTAGGFALVRADVAGSLPGVAVAVSLVPPLCVCGAALTGGDTHSALGAFLLFAVNMVAIVIAVGGVLLMTGFGAAVERAGRRLLTISVATAVLLAGLAVPLATTGWQTVEADELESVVRTELTDWIGPDQISLVLQLSVDGNTVEALVASGARPPPVADLQTAVRDATGRPVTVRVQWIRAESLP